MLVFMFGFSCDDPRDDEKKCEKCFDDCMVPAYLLQTQCKGSPACSNDFINYMIVCEMKCKCVVL